MRRRPVSDADYGDTREHIEMCLNCQKPQCTNCVGSLNSVTDMVRDHYEESWVSYDTDLSPREMRVILLYPNAISDKDMAKKINCPVCEVNRIRNRLGLPPARRLTQQEREELVKPWIKK